MEAVLQLTGTIAVAVLAAICFSLSRNRMLATFLAVGQDVFAWMVAVLLTVLITRFLVFTSLLNSDISRAINSAVFIISVIGICWSVLRHGKSN